MYVPGIATMTMAQLKVTNADSSELSRDHPIAAAMPLSILTLVWPLAPVIKNIRIPHTNQKPWQVWGGGM